MEELEFEVFLMVTVPWEWPRNENSVTNITVINHVLISFILVDVISPKSRFRQPLGLEFIA